MRKLLTCLKMFCLVLYIGGFTLLTNAPLRYFDGNILSAVCLGALSVLLIAATREVHRKVSKIESDYG
jgi:hypothetical protein